MSHLIECAVLCTSHEAELHMPHRASSCSVQQPWGSVCPQTHSTDWLPLTSFRSLFSTLVHWVTSSCPGSRYQSRSAPLSSPSCHLCTSPRCIYHRHKWCPSHFPLIGITPFLFFVNNFSLKSHSKKTKGKEYCIWNGESLNIKIYII